MKKIMTFVAFLLYFFSLVPALISQGIKIRDLPTAPSPSLSDYLPEANASGTPVTYKVTPSVLLGLRTLTCTPPLLCDGSTSMTLGLDRTLALSPSTMTSTVNGGPVTWLTSGSTVTGASNQGIRKGMFTLFATNTTDEDNALITINTIQRTHVSSIARTGIDIRSYTEPDVGGDTSGILDVSTGGGTAASFYLYPQLRPAGFTDYSTSSLQPAVEIGTSTSRPALGVITGVAGTGTYHGIGIRVRLDNTVSDGIYVEPSNNTYDATRYAYLIGNWQQNAAPVNVSYYVKMNGQVGIQPPSTLAPFVLGANAQAQLVTGLNADYTNGSHASVTPSASTIPISDGSNHLACGWLPALTSDVTTSAGSCASTLSSSYKGWTKSGTTVSTTTSTDKVGIGTGSPGALFSVSSNSATLPTPTSGTMVHVGNSDGTASRILIDAFASSPVFEGRQARNTAASPTATQSSDILFNLAGFGYGATGYSSSGRASVQAQANENWTDSAQGTKLLFSATPNGSTTTSTYFGIVEGGHLATIGTAPTVSCTGTGTSPTAPSIDAGGTDNKFTITMNTGTGSPGNTGTCTVTFATAYVTNKPVLVCVLVDGASAWSNEAVVRISTQSLTAPVLTWTNEASGVLTGLTVSSNYKISCIAMQ